MADLSHLQSPIRSRTRKTQPQDQIDVISSWTPIQIQMSPPDILRSQPHQIRDPRQIIPAPIKK